MSDGTMKARGASPTSANGASTDRLEEIVMQAHRDYASGLNPRRGLTETIVDALRAAGATVSPEGTRGGKAALPEPPKGPVTSLATLDKWRALRGAPANFGVSVDDEMRGDLDAILPDLAKDHGLLTPEEVERRAREWWGSNRHGVDSLVAALARPAPGRGV